ncbi:MAG: hypothetical protein P0S96_01715 [Simkaniaceae bacterium]|nr:hypothetical protein [Candidatus Sacchlamyda saccharinae]
MGAVQMTFAFEVIIGLSLFILFMATIAKECKAFKNIWDRFPIFSHYIPSWSFFAPTPYEADYYVLYRTISKTNETSPWKQAYQIESSRPFFSLFWNPDKLFLKGVIDIAIDLLNVSTTEKNEKRICLSLPYLHLLKFVESLVINKASINKIQFMIMTNVQTEESKLAFLSETHPI